MRALVVFEERELRDLIAFFLEGVFFIGVHLVSSVEEATAILSDEEQAFDILVCNYDKSAKPLITLSINKNIDLHFLCAADKASDDPIILRRKDWIHFFSSSNLIEGVESTIRKIFREFQTSVVPSATEFCRINPQTLLTANPLKGHVYVRLSDTKFVRIMPEGFSFEMADYDYFCRKKKFEMLYIKKMHCKEFSKQIQENYFKKFKEAEAGKNAQTATVQLTAEQILEAKKKRLEYLKERAKALKAPIDPKKVEEKKQQDTIAEAHAKSLEEKRVAMIQAKAKEILDRKVKADQLAAKRAKVKEEEIQAKESKENIRKIVVAKKLERELGAELEVVQEMSGKLGFNKMVQEITRQSMLETIAEVRRAPRLSELLLQLRTEKEKYISSHSMLLAYVGCALSSQMEWKSDTTYQKITLASFLHDIVLKNQELARIQTLSELAQKSKRFTKEEIKEFRDHPSTGAEIARTFTEVPPDVDSIIAQHHERPDGSGFPRGLTHLRIGPLATVFIVAHDIVTYLFDNDIAGANVEKGLDLDKFIEQKSKTYQMGTFKKVIAVVPKIRS